MDTTLPHSPACERNREPILVVLRQHFGGCTRVLEIGSGTGQHAVCFAAALPGLSWQSSDRAQYLHGIRGWLDCAALPNTPAPLELDVTRLEQWPAHAYDAAFTANTLHIMGWPQVEALFEMLGHALLSSATLVIYGPFKYAGQHTSDSNAGFDLQLKSDAPERGIRDFEAVESLARDQGFVLIADIAMPANNRSLVFRRAQS